MCVNSGERVRERGGEERERKRGGRERGETERRKRERKREGVERGASDSWSKGDMCVCESEQRDGNDRGKTRKRIELHLQAKEERHEEPLGANEA